MAIVKPIFGEEDIVIYKVRVKHFGGMRLDRMDDCPFLILFDAFFTFRSAMPLSLQIPG